MTEDADRNIFWLDYIIASDDPADQALIVEYVLSRERVTQIGAYPIFVLHSA
ncbi:hypothetical protein [Sphingobium boeckii]|uniref:Uncharacterized protein n=1 Tax=Sphingobium boeckii TaxID=1082345 RepID=A0A7W9EFQ0_9SPHN|nr:hypothetical protein [Sphingobium boeckii]MBB5687497.1 hypothetical protein [Sphingobium boeckii]